MRELVLVVIVLMLADASDWAYIYAPNTALCAKDKASCEALVDAINNRWLPGWPPQGVCKPLPNCFTPQSNGIKGFIKNFNNK